MDAKELARQSFIQGIVTLADKFMGGPWALASLTTENEIAEIGFTRTFPMRDDDGEEYDMVTIVTVEARRFPRMK